MTRAQETGSEIERIAEDLAALRDPVMRERKIVSMLKGMRTELAARVINGLIEGSEMGIGNLKAAYLALIKSRDLSKSIGYDKVAEIYAESKREGLYYALEFLKTASAKKRKKSKNESSALSRKLQHLSLGEKKAFARRQGYRYIEFLLHDTDTSVIENILKNPRITEREVLKIASNKKAPKEVLEEVFRSPRWASNYRIRKALIFNENTPLDIAMNLCSSMLVQDLRLIGVDHKLDENVSRRAREILKRKK